MAKLVLGVAWTSIAFSIGFVFGAWWYNNMGEARRQDRQHENSKSGV